ncbi:hypothetical protein [Vibrio crassostreae]|uniref:hypothetical protein n=1 Tax=Vibrio crassostreae TaxID=246167 RepID=UPI001B3160D6|nr:hypothetical protein [Vibrio crassostreae]
MFLAIDVDYDNENGLAWVAGVAFDSVGSKEGEVFRAYLDDVPDYVSGEFYKRELPCIERLLEENGLQPHTIFVDGYCQFAGGLCLGGILHQRHPNIRVIGVAKNPHFHMPDNVEVYRGKSKRPLYVTASGLSHEEAKKIVAGMEGKYRLPDRLKQVDTECRERLVA